jgi:hypothetical protein
MNFAYRMQTKIYSRCPQNRHRWAGISYRMFRRLLWGWNLVSSFNGINWFDRVREQGAEENIYWDTRETNKRIVRNASWRTSEFVHLTLYDQDYKAKEGALYHWKRERTCTEIWSENWIEIDHLEDLDIETYGWIILNWFTKKQDWGTIQFHVTQNGKQWLAL